MLGAPKWNYHSSPLWNAAPFLSACHSRSFKPMIKRSNYKSHSAIIQQIQWQPIKLEFSVYNEQETRLAQRGIWAKKWHAALVSLVELNWKEGRFLANLKRHLGSEPWPWSNLLFVVGTNPMITLGGASFNISGLGLSINLSINQFLGHNLYLYFGQHSNVRGDNFAVCSKRSSTQTPW